MTNLSCYLLGERAIVIDVACHIATQPKLNQKLFALKKWLDSSDAFIDVVPAMSSITAYLINPEKIKQWQQVIVEKWNDLEMDSFESKLHHISVNYGGEFGQDFDDVANRLALTHEQLIRLHTSVDYQVQFMGFLPGFAYLSGLPAQLHLPRKSTPITHVPKGSIAIADSYTAVYPCGSPGGWHLLGQTDSTLFDAESESVCLLQPGDTVRFVEKSC
ncbi:5-oxoprolinase subunit PxpB [Pseudoalteromonas sp. J010]|uniref:5-oxoprolinase subunit PxpB n=1 Tax=Pseudoalteromonas sp. J010 TaxID=998465 RepID=UPI000F646F63|nr:5-oxoprolinase subunit PxpB [Pseudoalteromonas sp. J010]RRS09669.1 5-oxoprolinase subunit PxpB [Pseudoalteromonas sp. J010]